MKILTNGLEDFGCSEVVTDKIKVVPAIVEEMTGNMTQAANTLVTHMQELDANMNSLFPDWKGSTKEAVEAAYNKVKNALEEVPHEVSTVSENLKNSCNKKVSIDNNGASVFN